MPFCSKCGMENPQEASFCLKCGAQIAASPMATGRRYSGEKDEKDEKDEKHEKQEKGEKSGDRTGIFVGGFILIWVGISFYLVQAGYFDWDKWWPYLLAGIGAILVVQAVVRYSTVHRMGPVTGPLIGGLVMLMIGSAGILEVEDWWPFVLIAIGVVIIVGGIRARSRTPRV